MSINDLSAKPLQEQIISKAELHLDSLVGTIVLPGTPRPHRYRKGAQGRLYCVTGPLQKKLRAVVRAQYKAEPILTPIKVKYEYRFAMPKSWSKKRKILMDGQPHVSRPDGDNLLKTYNDIIKGIVMLDDCQVCVMLMYKTWSHYPLTRLTVWRADAA